MHQIEAEMIDRGVSSSKRSRVADRSVALVSVLRPLVDFRRRCQLLIATPFLLSVPHRADGDEADDALFSGIDTTFFTFFFQTTILLFHR
jgi:hypothetical protein